MEPIFETCFIDEPLLVEVKLENNQQYGEFLSHFGINNEKMIRFIKKTALFKCALCLQKFFLTINWAEDMIQHFKDNHLNSLLNYDAKCDTQESTFIKKFEPRFDAIVADNYEEKSEDEDIMNNEEKSDDEDIESSPTTDLDLNNELCLVSPTVVVNNRFAANNEEQCFSCSKCSEKFLNHDSLQNHQQQPQKYCNKCNAEFCTRKDLFLHKYNIHCESSDPVYQMCTICSEPVSMKARRSHKNQHQIEKCKEPTKLPFQCYVCIKSFAENYKLNEHLAAKHLAIEYKCNNCEEIFQSADTFQKHKALGQINEALSCSECNKVFSLQKTLLNHMKKHQERYNCSHCDKKFDRKDRLYSHVKLKHENKSSKFFHCLSCMGKFTEKTCLEEHEKGKSTITCHTCKLEFCTKKHLFVHKNKIHGIKKDNLFAICQDCDDVVILSKYIRHKRKHKTNTDTMECDYCGKIFWSKYNLIEHIKSHINGSTFKCGCGMCFSSRLDLSDHKIEHSDFAVSSSVISSKNQLIQCFDCHATFVNLSFLENHQKKAIKCTICDSSSFCSTKALFEHKSRIHSICEDKEFIVCQMCHKTIKHVNISRHNYSKHREITDSNVYECEMCSKIFTTRSKLKYHLKIHIKGVQKFIECSLCQKTITEKSLGTHMKFVHNAVFDCKICGITCSNELTLKTHHTITHEEKPKILTCEYCPLTFKRSHLHRKHVATVHTKELPFKCSECTVRYAFNYQLKKHFQKSHSVDGKLDNVCDICGKALYSPSSLKRHKKVIHAKIKEFKCDICNTFFSDKGNLKAHKVVHTREKKFECNVCGNKYSAWTSLKEHSYHHSKELKPYPCNICERRFFVPSQLKTHMWSHTGEKPFKCKACQKEYSSSTTRRKHNLSQHGINKCLIPINDESPTDQ